MIDGANIPGDALDALSAARHAAHSAGLHPEPGDRVLAVVPGGVHWGWCMAVDLDGRVCLNLGLGRVVWVAPCDLREVEQG